MLSLQTRVFSPTCLPSSKPSGTRRTAGHGLRGNVVPTAAARQTEAPSARAVSNTPHDWHRKLADKARGVDARGVDVAEAKQRVESGKWLLVDVRPSASHTEGRPVGAVNIPLFDKPKIQSNDDLLKRLILKANGVAYLPYNTGFVDAIRQASANGTGLIFADDIGGRLVREFADKRGGESRSLKALYIAIEAGLTSVDFLQGGLRAGAAQGMPFVGDYKAPKKN